MKKTIVLFIYLSSIQLISAQKLDSIVFNSGFEKKIFDAIKKDSIDNYFIESLFAIDSTFTQKKVNLEENKLNQFYNSLSSKKISRLNPKKKVKYLFSKVHDHFFRKYKNVVNFSQIFKNGAYNCVSATALYAAVFERYAIPYAIKETPTHVYLIAYPNTLNIYIETTVPGESGYYSPSESDIKKAVNLLIKNKVLTQSEVNELGYSTSYYNYFFEKEFISKKNLIGLQYYNQAITYLNEQKYKQAYNSFLKSEVFYNSNRIKYLKISTATLLLSKSEFKTINSLSNLVDLLNTLKYKQDYYKNDINYYSSNISLANKNNLTFLISSLSVFDEIKNEKVKNHFKEHVLLVIIEEKLKLRKNLKEILSFARKAYKINPNSTNLKYAISYSIINSFNYSTPNKKTLDKINLYFEEFPFLKDNNSFKSYMLVIYAYITQKEYVNNHPKLAKPYFDKLKTLLTNNIDEINYNERAIGTAFWAAGAYFYKKGQLNIAKKTLLEGRKWAPDHESLNRVLRYINEDLSE